MDEYAIRRERMVTDQILRRGVTDPAVLQAMRAVPRHAFIPQELRESAYGDYPLPIGSGQTISQPFIVAYMTSLLDLNGDEKVLEVGAGSGYQAAVLSLLTREVHTTELIPQLARPRSGRPCATSAMITLLSTRATARLAGHPAPHTMPSWSPPAHRNFPRHCWTNLPLMAGWCCQSVAEAPNGWNSGARKTACGSLSS